MRRLAGGDQASADAAWGAAGSPLAAALRRGDSDGMKTLLSLGHGYSAQALAHRLPAAGLDGDRHHAERRQGRGARGRRYRAAPLAGRSRARAGAGQPYPRLGRAGARGRSVPRHPWRRAGKGRRALGGLSLHHRRLWRPRRRLGRRGHAPHPPRRSGGRRGFKPSGNGRRWGCRSTSSASRESTAPAAARSRRSATAPPGGS